MLSPKAWAKVEQVFGRHSVDLMAFDSNAMRDRDGRCLKHYTPCPTEESAGVHLFAQDISLDPYPYVFPPFCLISSLLKFLMEGKAQPCMIVFPRATPLSPWWPVLNFCVSYSIGLGRQGYKDTIGPNKRRFYPDDLAAKRLSEF